MDAEVLWEISRPFAEGYHTLSKGRGYVLGYGSGGPLAIPYSEISKYWHDRAESLDLEELNLFVYLVQAQDTHYLKFTGKNKKK